MFGGGVGTFSLAIKAFGELLKKLTKAKRKKRKEKRKKKPELFLCFILPINGCQD